MTKSKNNILSNKLDQAAKNRKKGYGKVVDSMKDEMIQAINETNVPFIVSNESDQAPKTRAAGYAMRLEEMSDEIKEAMDRLFIVSEGEKDDIIANYIIEHMDYIPSQMINDLKPGEMVSFEIKREDYTPKGWDSTVGPLIPYELIENFFNHFYYRSENGPLKEGQRSLIIVVKKDKKNPILLRVHAEQLEYPRAFVGSGMFYHNSNVDGKKFKEIIGNEE